MTNDKPLYPHADDLSLEGDGPADHSLNGATHSTVAVPDLLAEEIHAHGGHDLLAESAFVDAIEANETRPTGKFSAVERSQLSAGLDHQDAREQGPAGDVARDPELVGPHILISEKALKFRIGKDNAVEHFHMAALGIAFPNGRLIEDVGQLFQVGNVK
ncbi:MAG: hypothetical protein ABSB74_04860 [Tepidisphaeraceae bacterium]